MLKKICLLAALCIILTSCARQATPFPSQSQGGPVVPTPFPSVSPDNSAPTDNKNAPLDENDHLDAALQDLETVK